MERTILDSVMNLQELCQSDNVKHSETDYNYQVPVKVMTINGIDYDMTNNTKMYHVEGNTVVAGLGDNYDKKYFRRVNRIRAGRQKEEVML